MLKQPIDVLLAVLADFEELADREQKKAGILPLRNLAKKLEIQLLELQEQRLMLVAAESAGDKESLRALAEFSQFPEIQEWSTEVQIMKPQQRTLSCQNIQL